MFNCSLILYVNNRVIKIRGLSLSSSISLLNVERKYSLDLILGSCADNWEKKTYIVVHCFLNGPFCFVMLWAMFSFLESENFGYKTNYLYHLNYCSNLSQLKLLCQLCRLVKSLKGGTEQQQYDENEDWRFGDSGFVLNIIQIPCSFSFLLL